MFIIAAQFIFIEHDINEESDTYTDEEPMVITRYLPIRYIHHSHFFLWRSDHTKYYKSENDKKLARCYFFEDLFSPILQDKDIWRTFNKAQLQVG